MAKSSDTSTDDETDDAAESTTEPTVGTEADLRKFMAIPEGTTPEAIARVETLMAEVRDRINAEVRKSGPDLGGRGNNTGLDYSLGTPIIGNSINWNDFQKLVEWISNQGAANFRSRIYTILQEGVAKHEAATAAAGEEEGASETQTEEREAADSTTREDAGSDASTTTSDQEKNKWWIEKKWDAWEEFWARQNKRMEEKVYARGRKLTDTQPDSFNLLSSGFWLWRKLGIFQGGGGGGKH